MRVIGTAGHVDHGKSTLVAALTGINPDRLKEEQAREMTIELGFAWLTLPDGEEVGIVDVPGHRDFIENMLAGVGGIDAAMFVVAADEGVMPQTKEHLAILNILQVQGGVVALTKVDLVDDIEWLDLVEMDLRGILKGTVLENAPIVRVSARTGEGIDDLKKTLAACLAGRPPRPDLGRPRLPVDRVFSITGFGTIVTGTLIDGQMKAGDDVEILPAGLRCRIRGLQTHKKKEEIAVPGSRTAVNISGIDLDQVRRGDVLTYPGKYRPTRRIDVHFSLLADAAGSIRHNTPVKIFLGAAEVKARIRLLGMEELAPGQDGWLQLELDEPIVAVRGDRYILRRPSPGETLGGGIVIEPHPPGRHKRYSDEVISNLESLLVGAPADLIYQASLASDPVPVNELIARVKISESDAAGGLKELLREGKLFLLEPGDLNPHCDLLVASDARWGLLLQKAKQIVAQYHQSFPLRTGIQKEELKSRLKMINRIFAAVFRLWLQNGDLIEKNGFVALPTHRLEFNLQQQKKVDGLYEKFHEVPYSPPSIKECQALVGEDVYSALVQMGRLIPVSGEVVFRAEEFETLLDIVRSHFKEHETLTVIELRDRLNTSRRYVLAFLEYLDSLGITARNGDFRVLRPEKR